MECCRLALTSHLSRTMENCSAESNVDYGGLVQDVSEWNNVSNCDRQHWQRIYLIFPPYPKHILHSKL